LSLSQPTPPVAKRVPKTDVIHGDTRVDDYFWLREKESPEVIAYLEAENAYTDANLKGTEDFQKTLYDEMLGRIQETDLSVPYKQDGWYYYARTEEGKQYPIYCRKPGSLDADEQITLDLNVLAEGLAFLSLGAYAVSDDGNLLAYSTDVTGFREYTLHVKDLRTGELLPDTIEKVGGVHWAADNKTLFYTTEDEAKRSYRIYRHEVGEADKSGDALIYEDLDALYRVFAYRTRDKALFFVGSASSTATELWFQASDNPTAEFTLIAAREGEHEYYADHHDGLLYIRTNKDALNFKLVTTPLEQPGTENWTDFIPHRPEVPLDDHDVFARHLILSERIEGLPRLRVRCLETGEEHDITFPEPTYSVSVDVNRDADTDTLRFRYSSFLTPLSVFDYDMNTRERTLLKETPVLGGYDRTLYDSERLFATASDGTRVPISLVYKKGLVKDGNAALLLYGYGSYGITIPTGFSPSRLSLLDRGVVFAIAHIRGGGELGKPWHDAGKMQVKKNTFTDFIACAEYLIAEKYTSSPRIAMQGGSAGGLLMGAVSNLRPDLFHAVLTQVPFVDVINTMLDDTLPLTVGEYLEWGNPNVKEEYDYIKTYCPYTNLEAKDYPTTLVKTSLNDSQVMYWEPAKYIAKLRTLKTDSNPLLLKTNMAAGHGGASGRYDALKETALDYAFLLREWGITE
jgi:oligopeptidase B